MDAGGLVLVRRRMRHKRNGLRSVRRDKGRRGGRVGALCLSEVGRGYPTNIPHTLHRWKQKNVTREKARWDTIQQNIIAVRSV